MSDWDMKPWYCDDCGYTNLYEDIACLNCKSLHPDHPLRGEDDDPIGGVREPLDSPDGDSSGGIALATPEPPLNKEELTVCACS